MGRVRGVLRFRVLAVLGLGWLCGLPAAPARAQDEASVAWSRGLDASLARARAESRPVLIAINALDTERGNQAMLHSGYRHAGLAAATRDMVCLVANPNDHDRDGTCARYGSTDCRTHRDVLTYALRRWSAGGDLISPQHMILAPDGTLLWRKEYLIDARELQRECEKALVTCSPQRALDLAARAREPALRALRGGQNPKTYLASGDPLAAAVLLLLWSNDEDDKWLDALKGAEREAFGLVRLYLEEDPAFLKVAQAIDPKKGAWWSKRLNGKPAKAPPPNDAKLRRAFLALKKGDTSGLEALLAALDHPVDGPEVRAALAELAGVDLGPGPDGWREQFAK